MISSSDHHLAEGEDVCDEMTNNDEMNRTDVVVCKLKPDLQSFSPPIDYLAPSTTNDAESNHESNEFGAASFHFGSEGVHQIDVSEASQNAKGGQVSDTRSVGGSGK